MAVANPILATWDSDGTIRSYEFVSGVFTQIQSVGGYTHNIAGGLPFNDGPTLNWSKNGQNIVFGRASASSIQSVTTFNQLLSIAGGTTTASVANSGGGGYRYEPGDSILWALSALTGTLHGFYVNTAGAVTAPNNYGTLNLRCIAQSFDGLYSLFGKPISGGGSSIQKRSGYTSTVYPTFTPLASQQLFTFDVHKAAFAMTGYTFIACDTVQGRAIVGNIASDVMTFTHDLPVPAGTITDIKMCRDGRRCAISSLNGGTYSTFVYERRGIYYVHTQTIAGFGKLLAFSIDGYLLLDCGLKIAYRADGQNYVLLPGALSALTTIVTKAALDAGRGDKDAQQQAYMEGLKTLVNGTINLSSLKLTLLSASATFNDAHTTLTQVTNSGAYEVTAGDWPTGGIPLTGVAFDGSYWIKADPLQQIISGTGLSMRYAVVYDTANGNLPILWMDFLEDRSISRDTRLTFTFRDGKLVDYDR